MSSKQASYHAVAQYYQSMVSKESKEFGEEIARLKVGHLLTLVVVVHVLKRISRMCIVVSNFLNLKTKKTLSLGVWPLNGSNFQQDFKE